MKRQGFTLVELLVVIAIIALLMGILMPALAKVRATAQRVACSANLSAIGKAMVMYANDYQEEYPKFGGTKASWGAKGYLGGKYYEVSESKAMGPGTNPKVTITSSLYLLVRNCDMSPKSFICKGDAGSKEFKLSDYVTGSNVKVENSDLWDFGYTPGMHCSYAYHSPYPISATAGGGWQINVSSDQEAAVCADRSPFLDAGNDGYLQQPVFPNVDRGPRLDPDTSLGLIYRDELGQGNSASHGHEGQNVLFNDTHVYFEKYSNCGIQNDNIYQYWPAGGWTTEEQRQAKGRWPQPFGTGAVGVGAPVGAGDSYLINERRDKGGPKDMITSYPP